LAFSSAASWLSVRTRLSWTLASRAFSRQPFLHRLRVVALPDPADTGRRDRVAEFAKLVGDADLAISRPVQRKLDDDRFDLGRRAVL
jgi:hypothetical protein